ncbi:MAG: hypothetical protein PG979_000660 [Rickettsia asembonensis]|nr:MAG: hypothetical protein PG979_000660 [Rickettsia asembonensis]
MWIEEPTRCHPRVALLRGPKNMFGVTPWLDHGIQLKILKLLVFFVVFMDPVVKPRGDTEVLLQAISQAKYNN